MGNEIPLAILFGIQLPSRPTELDEFPLDELASLAVAAGAEVAATVMQRRLAPHPSTFIGAGKVTEIAGLVESTGADLVICDQDLSPGQGRNLEKALGVRILDRTELILDLFVTRAKTKQAKAQVELARLEYALPRLRRMWSHLDRERGGIGLRGTGEKQIEADRRLVRKRIQDLKKTLAQLDARATRRVDGRKDHFNVCLVGYANAGKSSLMNALSGADVLVANRPFATLDTRTRALDLGQGLKVLLSDTVGFIRDIPHHLVASFHATLAEAVHADLLLHVVDVSGPSFAEDEEVVNGVLASIGAADLPRLVLLNKTDLLPDHMTIHLAQKLFPDSIPVSAVSSAGLEEVRKGIRNVLFQEPLRVTLEVPVSQGGLLAEIRKMGLILQEEWGEKVVVVEVETGKRYLDILIRQGCRQI